MIDHIARRARWLPALVFLLLIVPCLAGCDMQADKTMLITGDWSRGLRLGLANMREPLAMEIGTDIYLAWPRRGESGIGVHFTRLSTDGELLSDRVVDTGLFFPRKYQLLRDPDGQLHLFILGSIRSGEPMSVFHLLLSDDGDPLTPPMGLTPAMHDVKAYDVAMYRDGDFALAWESSHADAPGIYYGLIAGAVTPPAPALVAADGMEPTVALEPDDTLHMIWYAEPQFNEHIIHYLAAPDRRMLPAEHSVVVELPSGTGTIFTTHSIGLDDEHVYIFWSTEFRGGMQQGGGTSEYIAFPRGAPQRMEPRQIRLPAAGDLPYSDAAARIQQLWSDREPPFETRSDTDTPPQGRPVNYSLLYPLPPEGARHTASYIAYPAPVNTESNELVVLLSVQTAHHMQEDVQPGMAVFIDGTLIGYQLVARTGNYTWQNSVMADAAGNLYTVWCDTAGEGDFDVYLATTAPDLKAGINRLTFKDFGLGVIETSWGMLSGLTLIPLVIIVMVFPLFWIALVYIFGNDDSLTESGPRIAFLISSVLYYAGKLVIFASVLSYPPFISTIPARYVLHLQIGVQLLVLALAFIAFLVYARRSGYPRLFMGFFIFAFTDALLTLFVYGPGFYR
jgi:hypothetical protein